MKLTNEMDLPEPLVAAIRNDSYDASSCDISTTSLIKPARIVALQKKWSGEMSEDASNRIFSLIGQAIHTILERGASERYIVEKRYISDFDGTTVGGQIDVFDLETSILSDYKITSFHVAADGVKEEWIAQASINRLLMERNGVMVKGAQIVAIFRDWSKMASTRSADYPLRQVQVLPVPLWPIKQTEQYIAERLEVHRLAATHLPLCNDEERWARPSRFALMKKGKKRAIKLYDTEDEATTAKPDDTHFVESRLGEDIRCSHYCSVAPYCLQFRAKLDETR